MAKETALGAHCRVDSSGAIHASSIKADCADTTTGLTCELNSTALRMKPAGNNEQNLVAQD